MNIAIESIWPAILKCRESLDANAAGGVQGWVFTRSSAEAWDFAATTAEQGWSCSDHRITCDLNSPYPESHDKIGLAGIYLRLLHGMRQAASDGHLFVTVHFAQSIDGRIATQSGDSQWIGNKANLMHAHRLRAVHDGILVGANTVRRDRPNLTVRLCEGPDPVRIILAGRHSISEESLKRLNGETPTWILCTGATEMQPVGGVEWVALPGSPSAQIVGVPEIVQCLKARGVHSLMIEGGSFTVSQFLAGGEVNELEIHVAPIVMGSGISSLRLPEIDRLSEAPQFKVRQYMLDGEHLYCLSPK
jgi:diaminohydroxyphosphoribosylaminopyrimidine deaminase/5-amino-6-(5-phosphoribosylamino)uracil reductase